jgi:hypothetical protein
MPIQPRSSQFQKDQADRIGAFLTRLAANDSLILAYMSDPAAVLKDEVANDNLILQDVALLLEGSYSRVKEVMSQGSSAGIIWVVPPWHI